MIIDNWNILYFYLEKSKFRPDDCLELKPFYLKAWDAHNSCCQRNKLSGWALEEYKRLIDLPPEIKNKIRIFLELEKLELKL